MDRFRRWIGVGLVPAVFVLGAGVPAEAWPTGQDLNRFCDDLLPGTTSSNVAIVVCQIHDSENPFELDQEDNEPSEEAVGSSLEQASVEVGAPTEALKNAAMRISLLLLRWFRAR